MRRSIHLSLIAVLLLLTPFSCKMVWRATRYNVPSVNDYKFWAERPIHRAGQTSTFVDGTHLGIPDVADWGLGHWYSEGMTTEKYLQKTGTVAFIVLQGDTMRYEYYDPGYADTSRFNSFSMGKVYLSSLVGIALDEGHIDSLDQSIGDYLEWCTDSILCGIKIRHLLQMTSGIKSGEGYLNPWATSSKLYYGDQLEEIVHDLELERPPGKKFDYININSQLMGMILARATGKPLATYLQEKIWKPLGMEADAGWSLHENSDVEKAFCCLNARARDFARFGLLVLNKGKHKGEQLIPEKWLTEATRLDTTEGSSQRYQHNWYLSAAQEDFYGQGLLGQFTYICPETRTVIIRIGNSLDYKAPWYDMFKIIAGISHKPVAMDFRKKDLEAYAGTWELGVSNYGDSALYGKQATMTATRKGLKVKTDFNKTWHALPETDSTFFNMKYARRFSWYFDEDGKPNGLRWTRRGNSWKLKRAENGVSSVDEGEKKGQTEVPPKGFFERNEESK